MSATCVEAPAWTQVPAEAAARLQEWTEGQRSVALDVEEVYLEHAPAARRLAYLLTGDRGLAEELVQDCFVTLCARVRPLSEIDDVEAYLRRMVVNASRSHFRFASVRRRRAHEAALSVPVDAGPRTATVGDTAEVLAQRDLLRRALAALPARQREAVILRHYLDQSEAQTAEQMGCGVGTVKALASRGRAALLEILDAPGNDVEQLYRPPSQTRREARR